MGQRAKCPSRDRKSPLVSLSVPSPQYRGVSNQRAGHRRSHCGVAAPVVARLQNRFRRFAGARAQWAAARASQRHCYEMNSSRGQPQQNIRLVRCSSTCSVFFSNSAALMCPSSLSQRTKLKEPSSKLVCSSSASFAFLGGLAVTPPPKTKKTWLPRSLLSILCDLEL